MISTRDFASFFCFFISRIRCLKIHAEQTFSSLLDRREQRGGEGGKPMFIMSHTLWFHFKAICDVYQKKKRC